MGNTCTTSGADASDAAAAALHCDDESGGDPSVFVAQRSRRRRPSPPLHNTPCGGAGGARCKVVIFLPLTDEQLERVRQAAPGSEVVALGPLARRLLRANAFKDQGPRASWVDAPPAAEAVAAVAELDAALTGASVWFGAWWGTVEGSQVLGHSRFSPDLRWLCIAQAGSSHVGRWLASERAAEGGGGAQLAADPFVTNVCGMHAKWIGEYVLSFMLMHCLKMLEFGAAQRAGRWQKRPTATMAGATVAVLGFGSIGEEVGRLAHALGARVIGTARQCGAANVRPHCDQLYPAAELAEVLPQADFVVLAVPGTPETDKLIGAAELKLLKPTAALM